jgi:hypothetical protein
MNKKYIVRLSHEERTVLEDVIKKQKGTSQKVRRAQSLLKADADGPNWPDKQIADAYGGRIRTLENLRRAIVEEGFEIALNGKTRGKAPKKLLNGEQEAQLIAMRLGSAPEGYGSWSLRLIGSKLVELQIVESISHETVRQTLKKME